MNKVLIVVLMGLSFYSCRTSKPVAKNEPVKELIEPASEIIVETNPGKELTAFWVLEKLWGTDNNFKNTPYLTIDFDSKTFTGNTGCNSINGNFTTSENYIAFDKNIVSTKMACAGNVERSFLSVLLKINRFTVINNQLELSQGDIVLMKFNQK